MMSLRRMIVSMAITAALAPTLTRGQATETTSAPTETKKIATIRLSSTLVEKPEGFKFSLFDLSGAKSPALSSLINTLNKAAKDQTVSAVLLDLSSFNLTLSQAQEIGQLINDVKAHKIVAVFASDYDTATYVMASHASVVMMPENGNVLLPGVSLNMMFFRKLLDNVRVTADFVQVGAYKGAEEPFTRTEASPEYKAQIEGLVGGMFTQIKGTIGHNRPNMDAAEIAKAIDEGWMTGKRAKELKLVDHTIARDKVEAWLEATVGGKVEIVKDYGSAKKKPLDMDNPFAILQMLSPPAKIKSKDPGVAVIYATGTIMPDFPDGAESGGYVTPSLIRKAVDKALKDDLIKAIVLRVDSPGGSASASEDIYQILKAADAKKPLTVSQGRVAASGGYYISCAGRSITADPATITGSIGVVGGKLVLKGMLDWAGVNVQTISRGQHANMLSMQTPFSDEERVFVRKMMGETYDLFKKRVGEGRGKKIKDIESIAAGRLFTGEAATKEGLADRTGTLNDAVIAAAKTAGIEKNYQVIILPEPRTISDVLREGFMNDVSLPMELRGVLKAVPESYRTEIVSMLEMLRCVQHERVLMALPGLMEGGR